jgi:beta-glucanase (GH16 family)
LAGINGNSEIDVMEQYGAFPDTYQTTVHDFENGQDIATGQGISAPPGMMENSYNTYGVLWDPNFITFYFDGQEVWQTPTPTTPEYQQPMMILADLALGGGGRLTKLPIPQ